MKQQTQHEISFETIGNATLIVYDKDPLLVTDPWLTPDAYFGSWCHTHEIPPAQRAAALACKYVWFSHAHPDHLNPDSLPLFKGKTILLPDHVGGRVKTELDQQGYKTIVLQDRKWMQLSPHLRILCWADCYQDAIALIDVNGRLLINCNDAVDFGRHHFIKRIAKKYRSSFMLSISPLGIADMLNFYDAQRKFIPPTELEQIPPIGLINAQKTERFGATHFIPFSSFHQFQRADSFWANTYSRPFSEFNVGFSSNNPAQNLPPFIHYDCQTDEWRQIHPKALPLEKKDPKEFGDNWSDQLEQTECAELTQYFKSIEHLENAFRFLTFRVGGKEHTISYRNIDGKQDRGILFEVPRASLLTAIRFKIFEDLLIGNFMKTTLEGNWPNKDLTPEFSVYVGKYADNGLAYTKKEVQEYLNIYSRRAREFHFYYWAPRIRQFCSKNIRGLLRAISMPRSAAPSP